MNIDDLRELLLVSPTAGAAESALATLTSLSRDGDADATAAVVKAMASALGHPPSAELSPCLRAWQAAQLPREFLANAASLASDGIESAAADFAALQQLVRTRHPLQDEALKAHVLLALAELIAMQGGMDLLPAGRCLSIVDRVLVDTRVIVGDEANDSLHFGRGLILGQASWQAFLVIIGHELGHRLLELLQSDRGSRRGASDEGHAVALRMLATHLPRLLRDACRLRGKKIGPDDPRTCLTGTGVRLLATHEMLPGGAYFHFSLMQHSGPIDLAVAARYAHFVLTVAGTDPMRAAAAYSPRGALHCGFAGDESALPAAAPTEARITEWIAAAPASGLAWLATLQAEHRFGHAEHELPQALGVVAAQTRFHGARSEATVNDLNLVAQARVAGALDSAARDACDALRKLGHDQTLAILAAAWRCAETALLQRLLDERPGLATQLRESPWPVGDIGSSLCAQRGGQLTTCHGPTAADIAATLRALRAFSVPLDAVADADGRTLLVRAAGLDGGLVRLLLACGADPDRAAADGDRPLHACADLGSVEIATALLAAGGPPDSRDSQGGSALHRAAALGHETLVGTLLAHGASAEARDAKGRTPLMAARTAAIVDQLCSAGAAVDATTPDGSSALLCAAGRGDAAAAQALLARGADVDHANSLGETAIHHAVPNADHACLLTLLDAGADVDEETSDGWTALMIAARLGHPDALHLLLSRGARCDARTVGGATALILAADGRSEPTRDPSFHGRIEAVLRQLVQAGADPNAADNAGCTALHGAARGFDAGRVKCLLELGADARVVARDGSTALAIARARNHRAMSEALQSALAATGADKEKP
ncbi:MAG: ankyrin repeat domain-containing protein [Candidatus Accumulibacter sp.]|nr:ankyrin repeat domain-containing protein [Accumulibacter sp.]